MKIDTKSRHVTPAGGNVFADLGFKPEQAAALQAESKRIISEKLAIKKRLMGGYPDGSRRTRLPRPTPLGSSVELPAASRGAT